YFPTFSFALTPAPLSRLASVAPSLPRSAGPRMQPSVRRDRRIAEPTPLSALGRIRQGRAARQPSARNRVRSRNSHKPCRPDTTHRPRRHFGNCSLSHTLAPKVPRSRVRCLHLHPQPTSRGDDGALSTRAQQTPALTV